MKDINPLIKKYLTNAKLSRVSKKKSISRHHNEPSNSKEKEKLLRTTIIKKYKNENKKNHIISK